MTKTISAFVVETVDNRYLCGSSWDEDILLARRYSTRNAAVRAAMDAIRLLNVKELWVTKVTFAVVLDDGELIK